MCAQKTRICFFFFFVLLFFVMKFFCKKIRFGNNKLQDQIVYQFQKMLQFLQLILLYTPLVQCLLSPFQLFESYNRGTTDWLETGNREHLRDAMAAVSELIPWLIEQPELPDGLDPLVRMVL